MKKYLVLLALLLTSCGGQVELSSEQGPVYYSATSSDGIFLHLIQSRVFLTVKICLYIWAVDCLENMKQMASKFQAPFLMMEKFGRKKMEKD